MASASLDVSAFDVRIGSVANGSRTPFGHHVDRPATAEDAVARGEDLPSPLDAARGTGIGRTVAEVLIGASGELADRIPQGERGESVSVRRRTIPRNSRSRSSFCGRIAEVSCQLRTERTVAPVAFAIDACVSP